MKDLEKKIKKYLVDRTWDNLRPGDLAKSVAIEAGELLEIFQWDNPELHDFKKNKDRVAAMKKELADVLIYCIDIAVLLDIDTEKIILEKLAQIEKKYPAEIFKTEKGKEQGTQDIYWRIKKEHRRKAQ